MGHSAHTLPRTLGNTTTIIRFDWRLMMKIVIAGIAFGLVSNLFATTTHLVKQKSRDWIKPQWLIPVIGGCLVIGLTYAIGSRDYLGLGVNAPQPGGASIVNAFNAGGVTPFSWFWKLLFTVITLGMGFKGGEVTPLFFIGAALGHTLAVALGVPVDLLAGLGFIAVFAGATNTPLACTLMGVELFGGGCTPYYAVACFTAYYFSGYRGIYTSQRIVAGKYTGFRSLKDESDD